MRLRGGYPYTQNPPGCLKRLSKKDLKESIHSEEEGEAQIQTLNELQRTNLLKEILQVHTLAGGDCMVWLQGQNPERTRRLGMWRGWGGGLFRKSTRAPSGPSRASQDQGMSSREFYKGNTESTQLSIFFFQLPFLAPLARHLLTCYHSRLHYRPVLPSHPPPRPNSPHNPGGSLLFSRLQTEWWFQTPDWLTCLLPPPRPSPMPQDHRVQHADPPLDPCCLVVTSESTSLEFSTLSSLPWPTRCGLPEPDPFFFFNLYLAAWGLSCSM